MPPKNDGTTNLAKLLEEMKRNQNEWSSTYRAASNTTQAWPQQWTTGGGSAAQPAGGPFVSNWPPASTGDPQVPGLIAQITELEEQVSQLREQLDLVLAALEYLQMMKG